MFAEFQSFGIFIFSILYSQEIPPLWNILTLHVGKITTEWVNGGFSMFSSAAFINSENSKKTRGNRLAWQNQGATITAVSVGNLESVQWKWKKKNKRTKRKTKNQICLSNDATANHLQFAFIPMAWIIRPSCHKNGQFLTSIYWDLSFKEK